MSATLRAIRKNMAARTLLLMLKHTTHIALPDRQGAAANARHNLHIAPVLGPEEPISCAISDPWA